MYENLAHLQNTREKTSCSRTSCPKLVHLGQRQVELPAAQLGFGYCDSRACYFGLFSRDLKGSEGDIDIDVEVDADVSR